MSFLKVLGILATFLTVAILWQNFMFSRFDKRLDDKINPIKEDISEIKIALNNHLSETNKKIDNLNNRFDKMNERFDKLYQVLLKDKQFSK